jgi:DNA-binding MarR family transcriptional regulator
VVDRPSLTALLSQTLVAFTIECDNESEHRLTEYTVTRGTAGTQSGTWLVSMAMWFNCMRWVSEAPITVGELERRARTSTNLSGMQRWRYIVVEPDPDDTRAKPPVEAMLVRATRRGRVAQKVWHPLVAEIEARWADRWGSAEIDALRERLRAVVTRSTLDLPDCLPIVHHGLWTAGPTRAPFAPRAVGAGGESDLALPVVLARALLMLTIDFEARSKVSLANHADVLRVLEEQPVAIRDLPRRSGVSKEAISMGMGILVKRGLAVVEQNPSGARGKVARLTSKGVASQSAHSRLLRAVEDEMATRFGRDVINAVRDSLEPLAADSRGSGLFPALEPSPGGWRASVRTAETLPMFPMVLHRGGYPDGS